jgi:hypothetical protein
MDFVNETKLLAGWTLGFEPDGRELLVVAIKGTFLIPEDGEEPVLTDMQVPLTEADVFTGEPGFSATRYETDYAHRKPRCDVLLNGSVYAPGGRPAERVTVAMRVGSMTKSFNVVGDRVWDKFQTSSIPTPPRPFTKMPISYDRAFGGVDVDENKPEKIATYLKNPIGVGYYPLTKGKALVGKPLPNTEEFGHSVKTTDGKYLPMSFGPIGRNYESRIPFAGTYDKAWLDSRAPFWPDDFDYLYFQAAPADQQISHPKGGEQVILKNLSPQGTARFQLPRVSMNILFIRHRAEDLQVNAVIDTVLIEPDEDRFMVTWRTSLPLRRNCFEIKQAVVGGIATEGEEESIKPCGSC